MRPSHSALVESTSLIDHDPHSDEQIAHAFEGHPELGLTRDAILDDITLYWLTDTGAFAVRLSWENAHIVSKGEIDIPAAFMVASPARSGVRRAAGQREPTATCATSTRRTRAGTSLRGSSRSSILKRSAPRFDRSADRGQQSCVRDERRFT